MKNNIKKAPVKFGKNICCILSILCWFLSLRQICAYNHLKYFQYGFPYHAGYNNMIFKDKLKSTPE